MDNKGSYSPEEVAEMCMSYYKFKSEFNSHPTWVAPVQEYRKNIPENIRMIINNLSHLERIAQKETLNKAKNKSHI